ncbi:MAG: HesA/MoeB/ThiF family protein [Leptolinea sp.]|nr:HesA/MoeB/ThiF family protein [Leptolinea sp.]
MVSKLTEYDLVRYQRQMIIQGWGEKGQQKIKNSKIFIIGAGGLGSSVALYLASAGVGDIRICDDDRVELSNLNRQILHADNRLGISKATSAECTLREINPSISITGVSACLTEENVQSLIGMPDMIIDCLDNYDTRFLVNSYCLNHGIPFIHGAVSGLAGQITFIKPYETPCLRCFVPTVPPKSELPIMGATTGIIGSLQAMEALKFITGVGDVLKGRLLFFDGENMSFETVTMNRRPDCPDCGGIE